MISKTRSDYISNRAWFRDILANQDVILCHISALECLELFDGYVNEKTIDVYARERGIYENINYRVVDTFDGIEIVSIGNLRCTSFSQTLNDMFKEFDTTDMQALVEALGEYYHTHNMSFDGIVISSENIERFNHIKDWAIEYFDEGGYSYDTPRKTYVSYTG